MNVLRTWDFLIANKPAMIIFLCASILIEEWESFGEDVAMERINHIKKVRVEGELAERYIEGSVGLLKEFASDKERVQGMNDSLLAG